MNITNLCLGCMEEKGSAKICPHCEYEQDSRPASAHHLPPGTLIESKYLLGRVLGQGGFGITYMAWDQKLDMKLAVKEYFPHGMAARTPGSAEIDNSSGEVKEQLTFGLQRFLNEAKTLARFAEHPNIVTVRDYFEANGTAYLVMSYVEGITLEAYLKQAGGKITYTKVLEIMMPVLDALREVHEEGFMHRDISPDNILINKKGRVILIDFGAARQEMREKSKSLSVILKAGYAPEEQYRSRGKQGPWTDIYAVAATIYRCLTGQAPSEAMDHLAEDDLLPPSELDIRIDITFEQVLIKALAVKAENRYQSVEEFQEQLLQRTAGEAKHGYAAERGAAIVKEKQKLNDLASSSSASVLAGEKGGIGTLGKQVGPNHTNYYLLDYQSGTIPISALPIGSRVVDPTWVWEFRTGNNYTGSGEKKPVIWIVVAKDHYKGLEPHVTLLSEELIGKYTFDDSKRWLGFVISGNNHWGESGTANATRGLRPWLNSTGIYIREGYLWDFSEHFEGVILSTILSNKDWEKGTSYNTSDKVFIPTTTEMGDSIHDNTYIIGSVYPFFSGEGKAKRVALLGHEFYDYWTRSPDSERSEIIQIVYSDGEFATDDADNFNNGVRPALNIKADAMVSEIWD